MGLDMYLNKRIFIGGHYEHRHATGELNITVEGESLKLPAKKINDITQQVAYWRKANAIHKWFVDKIQGGNDDCGTYAVDISQLQELRDLCIEVKRTRDKSKLPPCEGFFFGPTDDDKYYFEDIEDTIRLLSFVDKPEKLSRKFYVDYEYRSSW